MKPSTIWFNIKQGFINIRRNWMFSLASIVTMTACILLFGIFFSIMFNIRVNTKRMESDMPVQVFFTEDTTEEQILRFKAKLEKRDEVDHVVYTSADDAWAEWSKEYFGDTETGEAFTFDWDENPLAKSFNLKIYMKDIQNQSVLIDYLKTMPKIREINQLQNAANTLDSLNKLITYGSLAIILILLLISVFLISNTISVGITVRKEEIAIMKLIGATDGFVRSPFLLEGILLGIIGAAIPLFILSFVYNSAVEFMMGKFHILDNVMEFIPVTQMYEVLLPVSLMLGIGIGLIGSIVTTKKHLQV